MARGREAVKQPQELLMIVRTLVTTLGGATFKGKVPIAEGVEAFLFEKEGKGHRPEGILALWDKGSAGGMKTLALNLGERPRMVDLWGNTTPLVRTAADRSSQNVKLTVGAMPVFLLDIDGPMAQLRASVAFDRPLIESSFVPHARKVRFTNPYAQAISGTLKLKGPAGWTINPPVLPYSINPGEMFERDLTVEFPYNSYAGPQDDLGGVQLSDGQGQHAGRAADADAGAVGRGDGDDGAAGWEGHPGAADDHELRGQEDRLHGVRGGAGECAAGAAGDEPGAGEEHDQVVSVSRPARCRRGRGCGRG